MMKQFVIGTKILSTAFHRVVRMTSLPFEFSFVFDLLIFQRTDIEDLLGSDTVTHSNIYGQSFILAFSPFRVLSRSLAYIRSTSTGSGGAKSQI